MKKLILFLLASVQCISLVKADGIIEYIYNFSDKPATVRLERYIGGAKLQPDEKYGNLRPDLFRVALPFAVKTLEVQPEGHIKNVKLKIAAGRRDDLSYSDIDVESNGKHTLFKASDVPSNDSILTISSDCSAIIEHNGPVYANNGSK
jgi:hypothetical protein